MGLSAAIYLIEIHALELQGNGTGPACANRASIEFPDRCHFRRGAGEKGLVRYIDLVAGDAFLFDREAEIGCQGNDRIPGDALERRAKIGGIEKTVAYDKDILTAAFRDIALGIEQQGLIIAALQRLLQ